MEQLKKLSINTALCDMTELTEEILSGYSELNVNAATVLLSERASVLLSRYSVKLIQPVHSRFRRERTPLLKTVPL